ncbi:hypothetical protein Acsp06_20690 [Actinomycetospora sp. NBRC 106375]|uniref:ester cyclase n=1 Tax=Actinomycetospora sp. NBRC 106375 TaxID=3032207 RepID=UPI0024A57E0E|nr:ester cyclase [Actinomycetospora sp. NBRC 106375]GLZ45884.1 hypothetical protein Acsp06_20690 [Actinomycetospora sp. NBRC 106375]
MTDPAQMRDLLRRLEDAMNSRQLELLDDIMADDFVRHCQATPDFDVRSRDDFKEFLRANTASFPDNVQTFVHVVAEDDRAGIWVTYEGTQTGSFGPFPASDRKVSFDFGGIVHARDGKLAELWVTWDNMTILGQLGQLPA